MISTTVSFRRVRSLLLSILLLFAAACGDETNVINGGDGGGSEISVSVSNARDGGTIHSGFLIGTAVVGQSIVMGVEVSLDGGPFRAASAIGYTDWSFALPTGGATWLEGSLHTIGVRAVDLDGYLSQVTVLTVRNGLNKDVNGDGYADLAVGALDDGGAGAAYLFHGSAAGVLSGPATTAATILTGAAGSQFGWSVALGDVNGDGYADLAVGATFLADAAYVFHGSATGIPGGASTTAATTLTGPPSSDFGISLALGDVNGDGYADLAVGARSASSAAGDAYVFPGSAAGIPSGASTTAATTLIGSAVSEFGYSVALGDVNGDGYADLAVGARRLSGYSGAAYVFPGSATGIPSGDYIDAETTLTGAAITQFGYSIALGDVNGDGTADLAVGAIQASSGAGAAYVFPGSATGVPGGASTTAVTTLAGAALSFFGSSVGLGDVNGDGYADLAVGAYDASSSAGAAYVFPGSATGVPGGDFATAATILTGSAGSQFGKVGLGDVNGDGYADLAVGAPVASSSAGAAYVFPGSAAGIPGGASTTAATTLSGPGGSLFGFSVGL